MQRKLSSKGNCLNFKYEIELLRKKGNRYQRATVGRIRRKKEFEDRRAK